MGVNKLERALVVLSFLMMVAVNALAEILPINGVSTAQVSDRYPSLLTPAPYTFAIWGLVYALLLLHVLYVAGVFRSTVERPRTMRGAELLFVASSVANACWMVAWHFGSMALSLVLMVVILALLVMVTGALLRIDVPVGERLLLSVPFSVYLGWITVATLANAAVLLVSLGFTGSPVPDLWTAAALLAGLAVGTCVTVRRSDAAYGLTVMWAYVGILVRHLSPSGFAGAYPDVVAVLCVSLVVLAGAVVVAVRGRRPKRAL